MELSKEDLFCEDKQTSTTAAATDVLDFHSHGDDVLNMLYWFVLCTAAAADASLTVAWQTSTDEAFTSPTTLWTKTIGASDLVKGKFAIANEALPKGLKRYNRLYLTGIAGTDESVTTKVYPKVTAAIIAGRDEGTPFKGL